jgi:ABC-type uncharacterized transport system auxiliary subunit
MSALCRDPRETATMRKLTDRRIFYAAVVAACLSVALCLQGCGTVPGVRYYTLNGSDSLEAASSSADSLVLRVERFAVAEPYADRRIVYREKRREVGFWDFHMWAESPDRMITAKVADLLTETGTFKKVDSFPYVWDKADFVLKGAVLAFEEVDKEDGWYGRVKIVMELTDASSGKTLWSDVLERDKKAASKTPSAVVEALSLALDEVVGSAGSEIKAAVGRSVG